VTRPDAKQRINPWWVVHTGVALTVMIVALVAVPPPWVALALGTAVGGYWFGGCLSEWLRFPVPMWRWRA
jgi:hypothetical protein